MHRQTSRGLVEILVEIGQTSFTLYKGFRHAVSGPRSSRHYSITQPRLYIVLSATARFATRQ